MRQGRISSQGGDVASVTWYVKPLDEKIQKLDWGGEGSVGCEEGLKVGTGHKLKKTLNERWMGEMPSKIKKKDTFMNMGVA